MPLNEYHVKGIIINRKTKRPAGRLKITVRHVRLRIVAAAESNSRGEFELFLEPKVVKEMQANGKAFTLEVTQNQQKLNVTDQDVSWNHRKNTAAMKLQIDNLKDESSDKEESDYDEGKKDDPAEDEKDRLTRKIHISGQALKKDGTPVHGIVRGYHKRLRGETLLAETRTAKNGYYSMYSEFTGDTLNLIVRLFGPSGTELAVSPVIHHAQETETVNLIAEHENIRLKTEFEKVQKTLSVHLDGEAPSELNSEDAEFLENQTGLSSQQITDYILAHRLQQKTNAPAESLYGTLRMEKPLSLTSYLVADSHTHMEAMEQAIELNIISEEQNKESFIEQLRTYSVKRVLEEPQTEVRPHFGSLLKLTRLSEKEREIFTSRFVNTSADTRDFWDDLRRNDHFAEESVRDVQITLQLGALTAGNTSLTHGIKKQFEAGRFKTIRDLSEMTENDWLDIIHEYTDADRSAGVPEEIKGETEEDRERKYANVLARSVEDAFPTAVFASRLNQEGSSSPAHNDLVTFFQQHTDFEFTETPVSTFLELHSDVLVNVKQPKIFENELKILRRSFLLAPRFERYSAVKALQDLKLDSASKIARLDQTSFVRAYSRHLGGEERARTVHKNAMQRAGMVQTLIADLGSSYHLLNPSVIPSPKDSLYSEAASAMLSKGGRDQNLTSVVSEAQAKWESLFGRMDYCECTHCRSVYSPAAYLADLLNFLKERPAHHPGQALETLFERRSDIAHILLNCENTNTVLPYIDLVNEVLEGEVLKLNGKERSFSPNSTHTASELRAQPEHTNREAYNELSDSVYPWTMPYNLPLKETRVFLDHLGMKRWRLMILLQNNGEPADRAISTEYLQMVPEEGDIITGSHAESRDPYKLWGFNSKPEWLTVLQQNIPELLKRAHLTFSQLLSLLETDYINPIRTFGIKFSEEQLSNGPEDLCNLDNAWIDDLEGLSSEAFDDQLAGMLDRLHRFVRIQRKLNWTTSELDGAISTIGEGEDALQQSESGSFIVKISNLVMIHESTGLSLEEILSWYGPMNTRTYIYDTNHKPLYEELFLNPSVTNPVNERFELNDLGEIANNGSLSENAETISAALRVTASEFELLLKELNTDELTVEQLSYLSRHASLARTIDVSVNDFLFYKNISDLDPFNLEHTSAFMEQVENVKNSSFSLDDLSYFMGDRRSDSDEDIRECLRSIYEKGKDVYADFNIVLQDADEYNSERLQSFTRERLHLLFSDKLVDKIMALVMSEDDEAFTSEAVEQWQDLITGHFSRFMTEEQISDAKTVLLSKEERLESLGERINYVLSAVSRFLCRQKQNMHITEILADFLNVDGNVGHILINEMEVSEQDKPISEKVIDSGLGNSCEIILLSGEDSETEQDELIIDYTNFGTVFDDLWALKKTALAVRRFGIKAEELTCLLKWSTSGKWLNFEKVRADALTSMQFKEWTRLQDVMNKQRNRTTRQKSYLGLLDQIFRSEESDPSYIQDLGEYYGWDENVIEEFMSEMAIDLDSVGSDVVIELDRLKETISLFNRSGMSVEAFLTLKEPHATEQMANRVRLAAKSKQETNVWIDIAEPLQNDLREQQRKALVDYIVFRTSDIDDANDLYGKLLIDVEMSSCQQTSRITQAIHSVQLFVQRSLMNLEKIKLSPSDANEWKTWRKNYRIWEANRKVFLYPENWIEPGLRTGTSSFYKELEDTLMQQEVTSDSVEQAYQKYIEKLSEVANLEVAGIYHEKDNLNTDIVHVFARTRNIPHNYYYRKRIDETNWTPWERLNLDIEGDHLIPAVFNRSLTLFWPLFEEAAVEEVPEGDGGGSNNEPKKYWKIKMAWSVFRNGDWTGKQTSETVINTLDNPALTPFPDKKMIYFSAKNNYISCYMISGENNHSSLVGTFTFDYCNNELKEFVISLLFEGHTPVNMNQALMLTGSDPEGPLLKHTGMTLQLENNRLQLPYENESGESLSAIVLHDKRGYTLLPPAEENHDFKSENVFFVIDRNDQRTFFVIPSDRFGRILREDLVPVFKDFDFDVSVIPEMINGERIRLIANWDEVADGKLDIFASRQEGEWLSDKHRDYYRLETFIITEKSPAFINGLKGKKYEFQTFYHPHVCDFNESLVRSGIDGLLSPKKESLLYRQRVPEDFQFSAYKPDGSAVSECFPLADVDFSADGAYSIYNWELFFHIPFVIATKLSQNQRFEEAQRWFHYIFDPTTPPGEEESGEGAASPTRFWKVKPFYEEEVRRLKEMLLLINQLGNIQRGECSETEVLEKLQKQVKQWERNPFDPYAIAGLRHSAYMKAVVMKYLDNLIAWGDQLFQQGTLESINEAAQLYILAADLLGDRPDSIPERERTELTFNDILNDHDLDLLSNTEIEVEDWLPELPSSPGSGNENSLPTGHQLFFCIPKNEKLEGYWDIVEDRLFKIRHCKDIDGRTQQLPLFAPPIDPSLLVDAAASGVNIARAVNDLNVSLPHYRFRVMQRKAMELCANVRDLGAALLAALEKKDSESLVYLRATHETTLQEAGMQIRSYRIEEAEKALEVLERAREVVEERMDFYANRDKWNAWEISHLSMVGGGVALRSASQIMMLSAAPAELIPEVTTGVAGTMGSPVATTSMLGDKPAKSMKDTSAALAGAGSILETLGQMASVVGSYQRRWEEWDFQKEQAEKELEKIDKQMAEAKIRIAVAKREKENLQIQIEQTKEVKTYMESKFTNEQLYEWMISQLSTLYFQSYELAYSVAKSSEKAYQFELGRYNEKFIKYGHWDNLKRGLLAGERLQYELHQMDSAYLNQDMREYELVKDISLLHIDPYELFRLKETGSCEIRLPETLFDQDYPGHYMRRVKTVSVTIPCITGPYTNINATLTLVKSRTRISKDTQNYSSENHYEESMGAFRMMATSNAHHDTGMFELRFGDEKYLPFEGSGAESTWYLELPKDTNRFNFSTISDVLLHLSYTSREGGTQLRQIARERRDQKLTEEGLTVSYSAKQHFSTAWHEFLNHPNSERKNHELTLELRPEYFPSSEGHEVTFDTNQRVMIIIKLNERELNGQTVDQLLIHAGEEEVHLTAGESEAETGLAEVKSILSGQLNASLINPDQWSLAIKLEELPESFKKDNEEGKIVLNHSIIEDVWIVCHYSLEPVESE